jgi:hypothetical protein
MSAMPTHKQASCKFVLWAHHTSQSNIVYNCCRQPGCRASYCVLLKQVRRLTIHEHHTLQMYNLKCRCSRSGTRDVPKGMRFIYNNKSGGCTREDCAWKGADYCAAWERLPGAAHFSANQSQRTAHSKRVHSIFFFSLVRSRRNRGHKRVPCSSIEYMWLDARDRDLHKSNCFQLFLIAHICAGENRRLR